MSWFGGTKKRPVEKKSFWQSTYQLVLLILLAFFIRTFIYGLYQVPTGSMETTMLVGERFLADKLSIWFKKPERGQIITLNDPTYAYSDTRLKNLFERYVWGPSNWTKRVIGIPGDHVRGVVEDGKPVVYVNGAKLDEPYLNKYPLIYVWNDCRISNHGGVEINHAKGYSPRSYDPAASPASQPFYRVNLACLYPSQDRTIMVEPGTVLPQDTFDIELGENEYWVMGDNRLGSHDSRAWGKLDGNLIHGKIIFRIWSSDSTHDWWIVDLIKHPIDFWSRMRWGRCMQRVK